LRGMAALRLPGLFAPSRRRRRSSEMGKVSDLAQELRNHVVDNHTRGCGGRTYSCECGYDSKTERLLRAAAQRIEQLEATLRGMRERGALRRGDEQE